MKPSRIFFLIPLVLSLFGCGGGGGGGSSAPPVPMGVVAVTPVGGADNVARNGDITVMFDGDIDANSVTASTIGVTDDQNHKVEADVVLVNGKQAVFKPKSRLPAGRKYVVTIARTVKNVLGGAMPADYSSSFTTKNSVWDSTESFDSANYAHTVMDKHGNSLIVWWRYNSSNSHYEIVVSQLLAGVWSDPFVISGDATNVYSPSVAMDNNGNAIVVWEDWGAGRGVMMAEFRNGAWGQPQVITVPGVSYSFGAAPSVSMNDAGRAVIVWSQDNIYKKEYANGTWSYPEAISVGGNCDYPHVVLNSKSNMAITWLYDDHYSGHSSLVSLVFVDGVWNGPSIVSVSGKDPSSYFQLAFDGNDTAIVAWSQLNGTILQAYRNEFRNGVWSGPSLLGSASDETTNPSVALDGRGNAVMAWQQRVNGISQIFLSEFRGGGWNTSRQLSSGTTSAAVPVVRMDSSGNATLLWNQASGTDYKAYRLQYINGTWTEPSLLCVSNDQLNSISYDIAMDGTGDTSLVWSQSDGATWHLYRSYYHSDDTSFAGTGGGPPSGGYTGGTSGGNGGTGGGPINVSNWYWINPKTSGNNLGNVTYGAGKYVAVGASGVIVTSDNGSNWTIQNSGTPIDLNRVAYGGGRFVAVGNYGTILTSSDGQSWQPQTSGSTANLTGAVYNGSQFVVVGSSGIVLTSTDGLAWTGQSSGTSTNLLDVAFGGNLYVVSGSSGLILTSPDGITWTSRSSQATINLNGVAYGAGAFVAVGNAGTIQRSTDGINWTTQSADWIPMPGYSFKPHFASVTYSGTQFVAVGSSGAIETSADGVTWTTRNSSTLKDLNGVNQVNGQTVAVGDSGTALLSTTGSTWTNNSGTTDDLSSLLFNGSQYVAVGWSGGLGTIMTSPDGLTWTRRDSHSGSPVDDIAYGNGMFVGVIWWGTVTSTDGITWTVTQQGGDHWSAITYGAGKFVMVGSTGVIHTSPDGLSWTLVNSGITNALAHVTYGGGQFVAVGASGTILTSLDGTVWSRRTSGTTYPLSGIAYGNGQYVAVGGSGAVLTSSNGISWTTRSSGTTSNLRAITYAGGEFVAVGASGKVITSPDGVTWTSSSSHTTNDLNGITNDGSGHILIVGDSGTILGNF